MSNEKDRLRKPSYEELEADKERLHRRVAELERRVARLTRELEEARRWQKRQAAPFSRGEPKANPKRPGRPAGHPAAHRPRPTRIDRVIPVPLETETCPRGGDRLGEPTIQIQYQVDIPRVEPIVIRSGIPAAGIPESGPYL